MDIEENLSTLQMIVSFHLKSDWPLRVLLPEAATWGDLWKSFFENSAEFKGKHLGQSLFFQKVAGWAHNLIKKETLAQEFSC